MSKLREKLTGTVKQAKSLKPGDDMWDDMFYVTKLEQDLDSIINAVIEALPQQDEYNITQSPVENNIFSNGERTMFLKIKSILEEAKEK